jgi:bifunctional non-homologous end joining protein LigD
MSLTCVHQVALENRSAGSDKLYVVQVQQDTSSGEFIAVGYFGRRGASLNKTEKYRGANSAAARSAADKLEREKRTKSGYTDHIVAAGTPITGMPAGVPVFGGASTASAAPSPTAMAKAIVGAIPMLANVADEKRAEALVEDANWGMQCKYDGDRVTVSLRRSGIQAANRKGEARPLTAPVEAALKKLLPQADFSDDRETVFDGELMGDMYVIYDVITLRDVDVKLMSCEERYYNLEELLKDHSHLLAPMAWSTDEKRAMLAKAQLEGWEGVMFRDLTARYSSGRSPALLKHKFWATCTCRVLTSNGSTRSIQVALRNAAGDEEFCGNVTVPVNQDIPDLDGLVEVRYLYAHDGGSLYQPTLIGPRTDVDEADLRSALRAAPPEKRAAEPEPVAVAA